MKNGVYAAAVLVCFAGLFFAQQQLPAIKSSDSLGQSEAEIQKSFGSGRLVLSERGKEYMLVPKPAIGDAKEHPSAWSYGYKSLTSGESVKVEVQVGVLDDKPVYTTVLVPKQQAGVANQDITKSFEGSQWFLPNEFHVQKCADGRQCVKICKENEKPYCCRWQCVKSQ
jgi:hypothetical protein